MVEIKGPDCGYVAIVEAYLTDVSEEKHSSSNPLRPSSAGECERALAYGYAAAKGLLKEERKAIDPKTQRTFNMGHRGEAMLVWDFKDAFKQAKKSGVDYQLKYEQQTLRICGLPDGTNLEGNIDGAIITPHYKCLIDFKTKKDKFSAFHKSDWDSDDEWLSSRSTLISSDPHTYWINDTYAFCKELQEKKPFWFANFAQINMYFHDELNFIRGAGIDHMALIYLNKNDKRIREIRFAPSQQLFDERVAAFRSAAQSVIDGDPEKSKKEFTLGSIKCAFCPWAARCHGQDANATQAFFDTFPKKKWPKDSSRLKVAAELEKAYAEFSVVDSVAAQRDGLESLLIHILDAEKINRVKFGDGTVWEVKQYKTGGPKNGPRAAFKRVKL